MLILSTSMDTFSCPPGDDGALVSYWILLDGSLNQEMFFFPVL